MRISRETLLPMLSHVAPCADPRAGSVLACVHLSASGGELVARATDYAVAAEARGPCDGDLLACVPAKPFERIVRGLPEGAVIDLQYDSGCRLRIEAGRARYHLLGLEPGEFPEPVEVRGQSTVVDAQALRTLLWRAGMCVGSDESRPAITGALLTVADGMLTAVCTDGHRLAVDAMTFPGEMPAVILPRRAMAELRSMLDTSLPASIAVVGNDLRFDVGQRTLVCRRILADFPDYRKVMPEATGGGLQVAAATLAAEIARVTPMLRGEQILRLSATAGAICLDASDPNTGAAHAEIESDAEFAELGCNPKFITDFCQIGGTLTMQCRDKMAPMRWTSDAAPNWVGVTMPMRLAG